MASVVMMSVYDALVEAGASDEKARKAAADVTEYESRLVSIERNIDRVEGKVDRLETKLDALSQRMTLQISIIGALVIAVLVRTFF